jgi:hypothetical protein
MDDVGVIDGVMDGVGVIVGVPEGEGTDRDGGRHGSAMPVAAIVAGTVR